MAPPRRCGGTTEALLRGSGVLLIVLGVLMVLGVWESATAWVQTRLTSSFETIL